MTDQTDRPSDAPRRGATVSNAAMMLLAFAIVALAGVFYLSRNENGGALEFTQGGVKMTFNRGESLAVLLDRAIREQPDEFRALLAPHDFYDIQDVRWTNRLREIEIAEPVKDGVRQLLFDLEGPFALPATLADADQRLLEAVTQLDAELEKFQELTESATEGTPSPAANAFLASLVRQHLSQSGVFKQRPFSARVQLAHYDLVATRGGDRFAYVCPASELKDTEILLYLREEDRISPLTRFVVRPDIRVTCQDSTQTVAHFLARQPALIWLPPDSLELLYGPPGPGATLPARVSAGFEVKPKNFDPAVVEPVEVSDAD